MIIRLPLIAVALGSMLSAAEQAPQSDIRFTAPENWTRAIDPKEHILSLVPPGAGAVATITGSADYAGTADQWRDEMWEGLVKKFQAKASPTSGMRGEFSTMTATLEKADGKQIWVRLYSAVKNGRGEGVLFFALNEAAFRKNLGTVDHLVDGITMATPAQANDDTAPVPAVAAVTPAPAAPLPTELTVEAPAGWIQQRDPKTGAVYLRPPNALSVNQAALVVFPARDSSDSAESFHSQTLAAALGSSRQVEPVAHGAAGALLVSTAHCMTPQGAEVRMIIYTARWGNRAQAFVFATDRADLFKSDSPAAIRTMANVVVPDGGNATTLAAIQTQTFAPPAGGRTGAGTSALPAASTTSAVATDTGDFMPVLEYKDPPNFFRGGGTHFAEYQGSDVNFTLCVYPFEEFNGDIKAAFQRTLLRDRIDVMYREEGVTGQPRLSTNSVPGAEVVLEADFLDPRQQVHHRTLIAAGHWAAVVDMIAPTSFAWQKAYPSVLEMLKSMHVGKKAAPPSVANGPGPQGSALAGLFQGIASKTVSNLALGAGYLSTKTALHYFLFSTDGRVYRCYDFPPGGNENAAQRFDFDAAARQDPVNTGRFAVRGTELYMKMGNGDEITTTIASPNELMINSVRYTRK